MAWVGSVYEAEEKTSRSLPCNICSAAKGVLIGSQLRKDNRGLAICQIPRSCDSAVGLMLLTVWSGKSRLWVHFAHKAWRKHQLAGTTNEKRSSIQRLRDLLHSCLFCELNLNFRNRHVLREMRIPACVCARPERHFHFSVPTPDFNASVFENTRNGLRA